MKTVNLLNVVLHNLTYSEILDSIHLSIQNQNQLAICYVNVNSINLSVKSDKIRNLFSEFNIVHADGFGVFLGSRILYGEFGFTDRLSGSDLYEKLIGDSKKFKYKLFFFGDKQETLNKINLNHPQLRLVGMQNGFEFDSTLVSAEINKSEPDILIVGLGTPKQEEWIVQNRKRLKSCVILSVGDGIKVFAGTKKRGPKFLQKMGFEWIVRLFFEPKRLWKRYFIGIPLFIFRVIKYKFMNPKAG